MMKRGGRRGKEKAEQTEERTKGKRGWGEFKKRKKKNK